MSENPTVPVPPSPPMRNDEEIALEMMKFIATTTGYGRSTPGAGFQGGTVSKAEDYAKHLIELYGQCLEAIRKP